MIKTTAMLSAHTIHVLHLIVRDLLIVLVILLGALYFWLIRGIEIDTFHAGGYRVEGLYIKLDKKLTLKAKELVLPKTKAAPSFKRVDKTFDEIKYLLEFFDLILLERINFENNRLMFAYSENVLYISSDDYEIAGSIERKGHKLVADVSMLYLKKEKATLRGTFSYDLEKERLETGGIFDAYGIRGNFRAVQVDNQVVFALNTERFDDLHLLIERFSLPKSIEGWILERVKAKHYKLEYFKGRIDVGGEKIRLNLGSIKAKAHLENVSVRFHDKVSPAKAEQLHLTYTKGNLYFELKNPRYKGRILDGTRVVIKHVAGIQTPVLTLDLHAVTPIDKEVREILQAYHLYIPVTHTGKHNQVALTLKIPLRKRTPHQKIKADLKVKMDKGLLEIAGIPLHVVQGSVHYADGSVTFEKMKIEEPWCKGTAKGEVDLAKKAVAIDLDAQQISIGKEKTLRLLIKKRYLPISLNYKGGGVAVSIPSLGVKSDFREKKLTISFADLSRIIPYLKGDIPTLQGGSLEVESRDLRHYGFKGILQKEICFFYEKSMCYTKVPVEGSVDTSTGRLDLYVFGKKLHFDSAKHRVWLNGINIDLKRFIQEQKSRNTTRQKSTKRAKSIVIIGKKSNLRYDRYTLVLDSYDIEVFPNGDIKAIGSVDGDVVKFERKGEKFFMTALRVKDRMLHPLINFKGLKNGRYTLRKEGDPDKMMRGRIIIEGGVLSDFKAYSNTLAFINTLPALATLHSPGFSDKGFKIDQGIIEYRMTPRKIIFDSVYLKGNSATVLGKGTIDLVTRAVDMDMAILTVREFGSVVGKIPLVGYILMGDDNSMTVGLKVRGTLDDPKVSTTVAEDILTFPIQMLKRTIEAPFKLNENQKRIKEKNHLPRLNPGSKKAPKHPPSATRSAAPSEDRSGQLF